MAAFCKLISSDQVSRAPAPLSAAWRASSKPETKISEGLRVMADLRARMFVWLPSASSSPATRYLVHLHLLLRLGGSRVQD